MKLLTSFLFYLLISIPSVHAQDCTNPDGDIGVLRFNLDYSVLQICTAQNWIALHSITCPDGDGCTDSCTLDGVTLAHNEAATFYSADEDPDCPSISQERTCSNGTLDGSASYQYASCGVPPPDPCDGSPALGTECGDGSYYIGLSPEDGAKVYMTSVAHEASGISFDSASCYQCGDGSVATSTTDGRANTNALLAFDPTGFDAVAHCDGLEAHDHEDWYLPAGGSGSGTEQNLFWAMVQAVGPVDGIGSNGNIYWSSFEYNSESMRTQRFTDGNQNFLWHKDSSIWARCVRRD